VITVVPDTTVLVSAAISNQGNPYRLLESWQHGELSFVLCPHLLEELKEVLDRDRLRRFITQEDAAAFVAYLSRVADVRPDPVRVHGLVPDDPDDDFLFALAREAGVDFVLSSDQHLTELSSPRPPVITPARLVAELERLRR